jgi:hypothetical protein
MKTLKIGTLLVGLLAVVVGYVIAHPLKFGFCAHTYTVGEELRCLDELLPMWGGILILFFIPLFLFSLITYPMRDVVFQRWFRFARWWIPLSMVLILITPNPHGSWLTINLISKPLTTAVTLALFVLISTIIIVVTWWKHRKQQ